MAPVDKARAEQLVLQAAKVIYGGFDNWDVRGIRNLRLGVPLGGLTVEVVTVSDEGEVLRLEGVWDGKLWTDTLIAEAREDAAKKGGKGKRKGRTEKPKCTKGRVCGMTCIRRTKANGESTSCRFDPPPVVAKALNRAAAMIGQGEGGAVPTSLPKDHVVTTNKRITAARLDKALDAIDTPGAKERLGLFRAFVARTGVQAVFADPDAPLMDHLAAVERGLKYQGFAEQYGLLQTTRADPNTAGYTSPLLNHVVINSAQSGRSGGFEPKGEAIAGASALVRSMAETETPQWSLSSSTRDQDTREFLTYLHEMGHQVHNKAGLPSPPMTIQGSATEYGATNEQEWFAEHFALWVADGQRYARLDPAGAQFIQDTLARAIESPLSIDDLTSRATE